MAMQPKTWVKKATQKKSKVTIHDPKLIQIHGDPTGKTVATDRGRLHIYDGDLGFDAVEDYPEWDILKDASYKLEGLLSHPHLVCIAQAAKTFITKDRKVSVTLEFHPDVLMVSYKGENGSGSCAIRAGEEWTGFTPPIAEFECNGLATIILNPVFVIDALKGFAPKYPGAKFKVSQDLKFIMFEQDAYTAVIACLIGEY